MNKLVNKRECVDYILNALVSNSEKTSCRVYEECKEVCRLNGYAGECFVQLWQAACRKHEAMLGVRDNYGR